MIILTAEQAEKVRGLSPINSGSAIDPVPLKDGTFMLGEEVLSDPAHADVRDFLALLPTTKTIAKANLYSDTDKVPARQVSPLLTRTKAAEPVEDVAAKIR